MEWFVQLLKNPTHIAHLAVLYALVISLGVKLGRWKIGGHKFGIPFGLTWVLFVGMLVSHLCAHFLYTDAAATLADQQSILHTVRDLGLILFVYCIGLQVGPSFFQAFKSGGIGMNLLTAGLVLLNVALMFGLYGLASNWGAFEQLPTAQQLPMMLGMLFGAVSSPSGLGTAHSLISSANHNALLTHAYALAYPLGILGILLSAGLIKLLCKINNTAERRHLEATTHTPENQQPQHLIIRVTNTAIAARTLEQLREHLGLQFVVTRCIAPDGSMTIPNRHTYITEGMTLHLVCTAADADKLTTQLGERLAGEWNDNLPQTSNYVNKHIVVTKGSINGKPLGQLHFSSVYGVNVTRVTRNGLELFAASDLRLQIGDRLLVTGLEENISRFKSVVGAHVKRLDYPNISAIFFGILVGLLLGQLPIPLPGLAAPFKLGLAGGPLVVAILIGAFGYRLKINSYTSASANLLLREVGLALFFASLGLEAGGSLTSTLASGIALPLICMGFLITTLPILIIGLLGRYLLKLNYFTLVGMLAGANTAPSALAFANAMAKNHVPTVGYSTVYPLAMFLRILLAQLLFLCWLS